jgi:predicted kinase
MSQITTFIESFQASEHWARMTATVEASPWHREENTAVHTQMVMRHYLTHFAPHRSEQEIKIALIALLFHDTGKPEAEETKEKKDGSGLYRSYAGHEQASAVTFTECYLSMPDLRSLLSPHEARAVRWIIEHHLPYGMKDKVKRQGLRNATHRAFSDIMPEERIWRSRTFFDCLRSDANGRISDDHAEKLQKVEDWIAEFEAIEPIVTKVDVVSPRMFLLIGPSGSGKTTWRGRPNVQGAAVINADEMKIAFYRHMGFDDADPVVLYDNAWQYATIDHEKEFKVYFNWQIREIMVRAKQNGQDVIIDIVNASKKRRQVFVDLAKKLGFVSMAVEFWNTYETLVARQSTRGDKCVPAVAIRQQIGAMSCAWLDHEVQEVQMEMGT